MSDHPTIPSILADLKLSDETRETILQRVRVACVDPEKMADACGAVYGLFLYDSAMEMISRFLSNNEAGPS